MLFFLLSNLFLLFWFWKQLPNLFSFEFEISSFLLFGNKKESSSFLLETIIFLFVSVLVIVFNELKAVLRDQFLESSCIFSAFFFIKLVLLFWFRKQLPKLVLSLRSLLSYFQHSRTNMGTSKLYFLLFFVVRLVFIVSVLETITKLVLF